MHIQRRRFIQASTMATASLLVPRFLKAMDVNYRVPAGNRVLVMLQLSGGNDGLNTIIPYRNDLYYKARPKLGIERHKSLALTDEAGIHPSLTTMKDLYDAGQLGILNNVGYPEPDRSHFRSMDIWHTASSSKEYLQTGWLGRYLDKQCQDCVHPTQAIELDDILSLALKGEQWNGIAMQDPRRLYHTSNNDLLKDLVKHHSKVHEEHTASYLYKTLADTLSSAEYIFKSSKQYETTISYPATELGKHLKTISSLILSDINTKVYYVSLGSFDTHIAQDFQQRKLFAELNDALAAFVNDLKSNGRFGDVMLASFSEFGRRVGQNASGGTDHGAANNMFFISGALKEKGLLNALPDLSDLDNGDLKFKVDFRQVYATLLENWLEVKQENIIVPRFEPLGFV